VSHRKGAKTSQRLCGDDSETANRQALSLKGFGAVVPNHPTLFCHVLSSSRRSIRSSRQLGGMFREPLPETTLPSMMLCWPQTEMPARSVPRTRLFRTTLALSGADPIRIPQ
jgi:hypothetical protein